MLPCGTAYRPALLYFAIFLIIAAGNCYGQSVFQPTLTGKNFISSGDIFGTRVFIENRGQFDGKAVNGEKIYFGFTHGNDRIYFTAKGLIYEMIESFPLSEREMERQEKRGKAVTRPDKSHFVYMNWLGDINPAVSIEAADKQSHYITYGEAELASSTFKKITYRQLYPGIDIEFVVPEDKIDGIKYNVLLHPGADAGKIKFLYSGEVNGTKLQKSGDVHIRTDMWDLVEHRPNSFYSGGGPVNSRFFVNHDTIGFEFPEGLAGGREVIIDPYVSPITSFTPNSLGYEVDFDFQGNLYVFGSYGYAKVAKFNNNGTLLWTFSGQVLSQGWNSQLTINGSVGNFAVDKIASKSYIGQGNTFPRVVRLDASGNYDNFITPVDNLFQELWEMNFSCVSGDILIVGGGHTSNLSAATINTATPVLVLSSFNPSNPNFVHDISAFTQDDFGNSFCYYACSNIPLNHKITRVNSTYNGNVWTMPSGFNTLAEINNKNNYGAPTLVPSAGYNGLFANLSYLYYYDGQTLAAFDKSTGTVIATTNVNFGAKVVGGIAVDYCNNIYVGGQSVIACYNFNGTSFSTLTSIPLNANLPMQRVYDLRHNKSTGQLYVSGSGFVGTYPAIHSGNCPSGPGSCIFSQVSLAANTTSITCATLGSATIIPNNGLGPFSYTWVPSGQTGPTASGLAPGNHTVVVYDQGLNLTYTTVTTFSPAVPLTATISNTAFLSCHGLSNGTAAVTNINGGSATQNYTWTNGNVAFNTSSVSSLSFGAWTVTIKDALTGCMLTNSFQVNQPLPLNSIVLINTPTACVGGTIAMNGISAGGIPSYNYTWTNGPQTSNYIVSENTAGAYTYTYNSTDSYNCLTTALVTLTFVPLPQLTISNAAICPYATGSVIASGATSYTWNGTITGATFTDAPLVNTTYTVEGSAAGCNSSATGSIVLLTVPNPNISSNSPICNGQSLTFSGSGGVSYSWQGPQAFVSSSQSASISAAAPSRSGIYNLTVTAANTCTASTTVSLTVHPTPTVTATGANVCNTQTIYLGANAGSAVTFFWNGPNGFFSQQKNPSIVNPPTSASGQYSLLVYSAHGCSNTAFAQVSVTALPSLFPGSNSPFCEFNTLQLNSANVPAGSFLSWTGPLGAAGNSQVVQIPNAGLNAAGIYTLNISLGPCQNSATTQVIVHPLPQPAATYNSPVCEKGTLQLSVTAAAGNTISSYNWSGPSQYSASQQFPSRSNTALLHSGQYTVLLTDVFGCSNSATVQVNILPQPKLSATGATVCIKTPATLSVSGASTYTWMNTGINMGSGPLLQIGSTYNVLPMTFSIFATALNTCTNVTTATLSTYPQPTVLAYATPTAGCLNHEFVLRGYGAGLYSWQGPVNFKAAGEEFRWNAFTTAFSGDYNVTGTDRHGCTNTATVSIVVYPLPEATLGGGPFNACVPFCGQYTVSPFPGTVKLIQSTWKINNGKNLGSPFSYCIETPGDYLARGEFIDEHLCSNTGTILIHAAEKPVAMMTILPEHPVENTDEVIFTDQSEGRLINSWLWSLQDTEHGTVKEFKGRTVPAFMAEYAGNYLMALRVETSEGCADTTLQQFTIEEDFLVYVPSAFTPNHDHNNEKFVPVLRGQKFFSMKIFNRWGQEIYSTASLEEGWDGTYKGEDCKEDVYIWKMDIASRSGKHKVINGSVTLYR